MPGLFIDKYTKCPYNLTRVRVECRVVQFVQFVRPQIHREYYERSGYLERNANAIICRRINNKIHKQIFMRKPHARQTEKKC